MARPLGKISTVNAAFRIPEEIGRLWEDLSETMRINKTAVFITAIRELAKKEGVTERQSDRSHTNREE